MQPPCFGEPWRSCRRLCICVHKELGHVPVSSTIRYQMGKCYWNSRIMLRCLPFLVLNQHCCIWNLFAALLWG